MSVAVYTKTGGKSNAKVTLPKRVFGLDKANADLIKQVYVAQTLNSRQTLADTKTRADVRGGGRKPWRQKGTGNARAGTIRSPLWRGGGIVFGPSTARNYSLKVNAKTSQTALAQALTLTARHDRVAVIDGLQLTGKTKELAALLEKLNFSRGLIVVEDVLEGLKRAANNLPGITVASATSVSLREVVEAEQLLFTKAALGLIEERLGAGS